VETSDVEPSPLAGISGEGRSRFGVHQLARRSPHQLDIFSLAGGRLTGLLSTSRFYVQRLHILGRPARGQVVDGAFARPVLDRAGNFLRDARRRRSRVCLAVQILHDSILYDTSPRGLPLGLGGDELEPGSEGKLAGRSTGWRLAGLLTRKSLQQPVVEVKYDSPGARARGCSPLRRSSTIRRARLERVNVGNNTRGIVYNHRSPPGVPDRSGRE